MPERTFQEFVEYAASKPSRSLEDSEMNDQMKAVEIGLEFIYERAKRAVQTSQGPVHYQYQADGTPASHSKYYNVRGPDGKVTRCETTETISYHMQKGQVTVLDKKGKPIVRPVFARPVVMDKKKTAQRFQASKEFFPLLRKLRPTGLCLTQYSADNADFSSLTRIAQQAHNGYIKHAYATEEASWLAEMTDLVYAIDCILHDIQGGVRRMLTPWHQQDEKKFLRDMFVGVASYRDGFSLVIKWLPRFLPRVQWKDKEYDQSIVLQFWLVLGFKLEFARQVALLHPELENGVVTCNRAFAALYGDELNEKASAVFLKLWKAITFTTTRFSSVGICNRRAVAAHASGFKVIWQQIKDEGGSQ